MKNILSFVIIIILFYSCKKETFPKCECQDENWPNFAIIAQADNIIICDTTKVITRSGVHGDTTIVASYKNQQEFLTKSKIGSGSEKIYDCNTGKTIRHEFGPYDKYYKEKRLIIEPIDMFYYWNTTEIPEYLMLDSLETLLVDPRTKKGRWEQKYYSIYREEIYAKKGIIMISDKKMILEPPYVDNTAIKGVSFLFDYYRNNIPRNKELEGWLRSLEGKLLTCALNGDSISKERLINFKDYFPMYKNGNLTENIDLLKKYEKNVLTHNNVYN